MVNEMCAMDGVYIYGAGIQGKFFFDIIQSEGTRIDCFVDDYYEAPTCKGKPVIRAHEIRNKQAYIFISVGLISTKIKSNLVSQGFENVFDFTQSVLKFPAIIQSLKGMSLWYSDTLSDMVNDEGIAEFRTLLSDEKSKNLLDTIAAFRRDFSPENYVIPDGNIQYFPDDIDVFSNIDAVRFVDAGAYIGDTVGTLARVCKERNIFFEYGACFEPDRKNLAALKSRVAKLRSDDNGLRFFVYPAGVWHQSEILTFSADQAASSCVVEGIRDKAVTNSISGLAIDDCLFNAAPNFIKLDVEGAEQNALMGARQCIETYHPVLAICLYHRPRDLWELPLFVHSLSVNYDMFLRVYGDMLLETVLYCVPKKV
ncbi:MAG: FkbM family methyltransferase [Rhodospirillales bacterium]|nr:FkbM family methyltransferase [Rhodospirillales bacterium]